MNRKTNFSLTRLIQPSMCPHCKGHVNLIGGAASICLWCGAVIHPDSTFDRPTTATRKRVEETYGPRNPTEPWIGEVYD